MRICFPTGDLSPTFQHIMLTLDRFSTLNVCSELVFVDTCILVKLFVQNRTVFGLMQYFNIFVKASHERFLVWGCGDVRSFVL
jgi:hypothetical protein